MTKEIKLTLAAARVNRGLTLKEAADYTGLAKDTIYKIESGRSDPRYSTLVKLCNLYNVSINDIVLHTKSA